MALQDTNMLFILGRGRSGTSLLQTILNAHPQISVAPEAQFIMFLRRRYAHQPWNHQRIKAFARDLWLEERLQNWHLDAEVLEKQLLQHSNKANYANLCKEVYYQYGQSKQKNNLKIVGDKNPHYALYIKHLVQLYPRAKFVHMVRDPRDTILSYKAVNFDANHTATLAHRWNIYNRAIMQYRKLMPERFYLVHFENLLNNPEHTLKNLCKFLNVKYDAEMLNFYKLEQDWEAEFRKNLKNPLDPGKAYQWKNKMSKKQVQVATAITAPLAGQFGYEITAVQNARLKKAFALPHLFYARWVTFLERLVYTLPLGIVAPIIAFYRRLTASDN